jgi:hypothetical protein
LSQFDTEHGVTYSEVESRATTNRHGDRTVTTTALIRRESGGVREVTFQLDILSAAVLVNQVTEAIETHYAELTHEYRGLLK